ncbi:tRNA (adenosine(37)-N6)-methyltransferase TrmM, partial [Salmonella enterica subsp. enterica serovar Infantis]
MEIPSQVLFSPGAVAVFLQGCFYMSQSCSVLRRNGFTFKQFFFAHDRCAMKVGTDGILLGA